VVIVAPSQKRPATHAGSRLPYTVDGAVAFSL
jgi:hypothetical protein